MHFQTFNNMTKYRKLKLNECVNDEVCKRQRKKNKAFKMTIKMYVQVL